MLEPAQPSGTLRPPTLRLAKVVKPTTGDQVFEAIGATVGPVDSTKAVRRRAPTINGGTGSERGSFNPKLVRGETVYKLMIVWNWAGEIQIPFQVMREPPFNTLDRRREFADRLVTVPGSRSSPTTKCLISGQPYESVVWWKPGEWTVSWKPWTGTWSRSRDDSEGLSRSVSADQRNIPPWRGPGQTYTERTESNAGSNPAPVITRKPRHALRFDCLEPGVARSLSRMSNLRQTCQTPPIASREWIIQRFRS